MKGMTRRTFLAGTGKAAAGAALGRATLTAASAEKVKGANGRVNIAMIGCGGRGRYVTYGLIDEAGANLTCLCDLRDDRLGKTWEFLSKIQKNKPRMVKDMRQVFDAKDVDAVVVSTPDHWHAPTTIRACQAGKDVYVEKPHSHNIWESRKMVEAARKYERIVQVGTQNRSAPYNLSALEYVRSGKLGGVHLVKVYNLKPGGPFHLGKSGPMPKDFDWDAWLGAAPKRPWHSRLFSSGWHKYWDFCGGDMGDDGIHQIDLALMLMGDPPPPGRVSCNGGRIAHKGDDAEVPDVQVVSYDFGTFIMTFEMTGYPRYMRKTTGTIRRNDLLPYWTQNATRIELYGSELMMTIGRHGGGWIVQTSGGKLAAKTFGRVADFPHYKNFVACVKSRKRPNADIALAHATCSTMHMGNISYRVGCRSLRYDPKAEKFDLPEANKLIKRDYRKGYEIPEQV